MRKISVFILLTLFGSLSAQDAATAVVGAPTLDSQRILVVPFKSPFLLSEIDRGLVEHSRMDVLEIRKEIPKAICNAFSVTENDSLEYRLLSLDKELSNLSYIHHNLSFGYAEIIAKEDTPKKKWFKKEKIQATGELTGVNNGQIDKTPIYKERYMSATINSEELLQFIDEEYRADLIVVLTELDLMKSKVEGAPYNATLHYVIYNSEGERLDGNKVIQPFGRDAFNFENFTVEVLIPLGQSIADRSMLYLANNSSPDIIGGDDDDIEY